MRVGLVSSSRIRKLRAPHLPCHAIHSTRCPTKYRHHNLPLCPPACPLPQHSKPFPPLMLFAFIPEFGSILKLALHTGAISYLFSPYTPLPIPLPLPPPPQHDTLLLCLLLGFLCDLNFGACLTGCSKYFGSVDKVLNSKPTKRD